MVASNQKKPVNFSAAKTVLFKDQFKIVTTTTKRGFAQMHLTTILIGYFKLPVFTVHVSAWISSNVSVGKALGGSPHSWYVHILCYNLHHN